MADLPTVVCFGDSNTWGYDPATAARFPRKVRWTGVLARSLSGAAHVVEEGLNGRTTVWESPFAPGRCGRDYLGPCLASHAPVHVLVVMLGTNDLKAIFRLAAPDVAAGAAALVDLALASRSGRAGGPPRVLLVSPPRLGAATDMSMLWGFGAARESSAGLGPLYRTAAGALGCAFLDADPLVTMDPADGVHLDAGGHAVLGAAIAEAVRTLLDDARS
ncbi:MAG: SGNH/GDSL hydrolase family protein [Chloroflexi bacterium]|jgi:lysophospholipase L1-like esterase|nr:SGNH/GDSL hydrolase family protein [Chloroflexota bacterium]